MFLLLNEQGELRAGWKVLLFAVAFITITLPFSFLFNFISIPIKTLPVSFIFAAFLSNWIMSRYVDQKPLSYIGLDWTGGLSSALKEYAIGIFSGALAMSVIALLMIYVTNNSFELNSEIQFNSILSYLILMILVGVYEELQLRGYILRVLSDGFRFKGLSEKQGLFIAVAFTSGLFGVLHHANPNSTWISTSNIALAGILLALPILVTGRLYISFGLHFSWNWFQGGLFGMPVSGGENTNAIFHYINTSSNDLLTGGAFGPEAGFFGIIGMIVAAIPVWFIYKNQSNILRIFELQFNQFSKTDVVTSTEKLSSNEE